MKKFIVPIIILGLLGVMLFQGVGVYNGLVEDDENQCWDEHLQEIDTVLLCCDEHEAQ